jgi:hypothetical protein
VARGGAVAEPEKVGGSGWRERKAEIPIIAAAMNGIGRRAEQKPRTKRSRVCRSLPLLLLMMPSRLLKCFCSMRAYVATNRRPGCIRIGILGLPFSRHHPSRRTLTSRFQSQYSLLSKAVFKLHQTLLILIVLHFLLKRTHIHLITKGTT